MRVTQPLVEGEVQIPPSLKGATGDHDCTHHNHATIGGHSDTSSHCDCPATDYRTIVGHWLPPEQQLTYQEVQQARSHAWQVDTERRAM
jgi:hypothetical protein